MPPPQQKFSRGRPSKVAIAAFQADAIALEKPPEPIERLGIIHLYAVVAPKRVSCSGAISLVSQPRERRASESTKTRTSIFSGSDSTAFLRFCTLPLQPSGGPANTM